MYSLDSILTMPPCPHCAAQPTLDQQPNLPAEPGHAMGVEAPQCNEQVDDGDIQPCVPNVPHWAPQATTACHVTQPLDDDGKTFDLHVSGNSSDSDEYNPHATPTATPAALNVPLAALVIPPPAPNAQVPAASNNAGSLPVQVPGSQDSSRARTAAHDINHFFRQGDKKEKGSQTVCKVCE